MKEAMIKDEIKKLTIDDMEIMVRQHLHGTSEGEILRDILRALKNSPALAEIMKERLLDEFKNAEVQHVLTDMVLNSSGGMRLPGIITWMLDNPDRGRGIVTHLEQIIKERFDKR